MRTVTAAGAGRTPSAIVTEAGALLTQADARRSHSPEPTVVGVFGATGSGKSSLVNALVRDEAARALVRRPTTSQALAITWDGAGAADLRDGLLRARVLSVSARTLEGIDALRSAIGDQAASRAVRDARLTADVQTLAARIDGPGSAPRLDAKAALRLRDDIGTASGVDVVAAAVASSYRKHAGQATGWPLVSWIGCLRADPLAHPPGTRPEAPRR